MPSVVTANRIIDGIVVYLGSDGGWVEELARAKLAHSEEGTKALESEAPRPSPSAAWSPSIPWRSRSTTACRLPRPCASASAPPTEPL